MFTIPAYAFSIKVKCLQSNCVQNCALKPDKIRSESFHERNKNEFVYFEENICTTQGFPSTSAEFVYFIRFEETIYNR